MSDPYAGLVMPKPPKGYRLAKWNECYTYKDGSTRAVWWCPSKSMWVFYGNVSENDYSFLSTSVFAIPKPRYRVDLEIGEQT